MFVIHFQTAILVPITPLPISDLLLPTNWETILYNNFLFPHLDTQLLPDSYLSEETFHLLPFNSVFLTLPSESLLSAFLILYWGKTNFETKVSVVSYYSCQVHYAADGHSGRAV
jgi:hypothetical protein